MDETDCHAGRPKETRVAIIVKITVLLLVIARGIGTGCDCIMLPTSTSDLDKIMTRYFSSNAGKKIPCLHEHPRLGAFQCDIAFSFAFWLVTTKEEDE